MNTVRLIALVESQFSIYKKEDKDFAVGTVRYNRPGNSGGFDILPVIVKGNDLEEITRAEPGCLVAMRNASLINIEKDDNGRRTKKTLVVAYSAVVIFEPLQYEGEYDSFMDNSIVLTGRWSKEPQLKYTPGRAAVCNCSIAVDRLGKPDFFSVCLFNKKAEATSKHTSKGYLVAIDGRIQARTYQKDGEDRVSYEIVVNNIDFLAKPKNSSSGVNNGNNTGYNDGYQEVPFSEDNLPF